MRRQTPSDTLHGMESWDQTGNGHLLRQPENEASGCATTCDLHQGNGLVWAEAGRQTGCQQKGLRSEMGDLGSQPNSKEVSSNPTGRVGQGHNTTLAVGVKSFVWSEQR